MPAFELLVFAADPARAAAVLNAGASGVIVDWENKGKPERQQGADTEINFFGPEDLLRVRRRVNGHVICRINGFHGGTAEEIQKALDSGAGEIFLPMVRSLDHAERFLRWVNGRAQASILIETQQAILLAPELGAMPFRRIYIGLNDLAIDRGSSQLFAPVADGLLDSVRPHISTPAFGFGGLTLPERGSPVPCRLLLGEITRLDCSFTFLRRSFWRDTEGRDLNVEVPRILAAVTRAQMRRSDEVERDRQAFAAACRAGRAMAAAGSA